MSSSLSGVISHRLENAVRVLCPLIQQEIRAQAPRHWREYDLRRELVGCILGSQVRFELAVSSTEGLESAGLLNDDYWSGSQKKDFSRRVFEVLSGQNQGTRGACHRFPRSRAIQLAQTRDALARIPLLLRLAETDSSRSIRQRLVEDLPGIGPKQASMFLRNIGKSYDLAILDTHVLRFLESQDLLGPGRLSIGTMVGYERVELILINYALVLGYPAGCIDWAIWVTMRAVRELDL